MAQGWAGNAAPAVALKCADCLVVNRSVNAMTQVDGTLVCQDHAKERMTPLVPELPVRVPE